MKIYFDKSKRPEPSKIYLATSDHRILCALNGIDESSCYFTANLNNVYEISFDINRYINISGKTIESNGYHLINVLMRLYVTNIGWFIISPPSVHNDGIKETKSIKAQSVEIEMMQHDIKNLKINKGTSDSYEMLIEGNVDKIDDVEFAKEHIKFYNPKNPKLSLLNILLIESGLYNWKIGYIDDIPKKYQYYENGILKEKYIKLSDEIGSFDIESQNLYSFLTQDAAQFYGCLFIFDRKNLIINAYRPENLGKDTNINIGFRNLQKSNEISVDEDNIYTRYSVYGSDNLGIQYVNFGSNIIENISGYFLNEKYMPADLIEKYSLWQNDVEKNRTAYIESTRRYNEQLKIISELHDRVPLDDCSTDWSTFPDDRLLEAQANYQAQLKGYESFYIDENGDFDLEALDASVDANDYYQIRDVILPSIQIEIDNRNLPAEDDELEYIKTYETNWKLYGLDELDAKLQTYKNIIKVCESGNYHVPYTENSGHTEDYHNEMYQKYLDAHNQLNPDFIGSCQEAYNQRKSEINSATEVLDQHDARRKEISRSLQKETWHNEDYYFSETDLACLSKLYIDCDYTNNNMFLTSSDDSVSEIDEQLKLLRASQEDLYSASQPQYIYSTDLDNFLAKYEYKNYTDNLNLGDFLYLGIRDNYVVKLRTISMKYNPLLMKNDLQITFSNMIRSQASRNDFLYLIDVSSKRSKHSSSGNSNDFLSNEGITLTPGLIQKLLQNGAFKNSVDQMIENGMAVNGNKIILGTGTISVSELNSKMINVVNISGENAFFDYLQAKLIAADKIIADSGKFLDLSSLVANIDNLLAGNVSAELGHLIKMTAENVEIDEAVIRDLIAAQITVSMLKADTISSNKFNIESDDGGMTIVGNTMQFKDTNGNLRIQIGRDADNDFTFVLYDETGTGVLMDSTGIKPSAISDGIIQNNMIAKGSITKDRLGFKVVDTDENGKICITEILDESGQSLGVSYKEIQKTITELEEQIDSTLSYNVHIENEYQNIPCVNGTVKNNILIEIPFTGYKGTIQVPASVTTSVLPSGMTVGINNPSTDTDKGSLILNIAEGATLGNKNITTGFINLTFSIDTFIMTKRFTWSKTNDGDSANASICILEASTELIKRENTIDSENNTITTLSPSSITFSSFVKTLEKREPYEGRFLIETSLNGVDFDNMYVSPSDESAVSFTPSNNVQSIRCTLYQTGSIINIIDRKTITVLDGIDSIKSEITQIKDSFTTLSDTVDKTEKAISEKVWQTEIDTSINNYDNSSIKVIRDTVAEHKTSIGSITDKVTSVEDILETKADGSIVKTLSEKVSFAEQDMDGFKQIVSSTYAAKDDVSSVESALIQKDNEIEAQVENTKDELAFVKVKADNISSTVTKKMDMPFVSIRYIRDWLNGSSAGSLNHWLECQVSVDGTNIARGLVPAAKDTTGEPIVSIDNLSYYTDESINTEDCVTSNGNGQWQCLQLDLEELHRDIDCIRIWHNYTDGHSYNHRLQVSENGSDWITLFDSDIQGTYQESEKGKTYYLNDSSILENFSSIRQDISSVTSQIQDESAKIQSIVSQTQRDFGVQIESLQNNIENIEIHNDELSQKIENAKAEFLLSLNSYITRLQSVENGLKNQSEVIQTSEGWKLIFKKIGMYDGSDVPDQETYTNIDIDGIEVSNPIENTKATLKTDGIKGYYNNEVIFQLQKDATITERLYAKRGIDTYTMKIIPVVITQNSVTKSGVAFVKSGGDS